MKNFSIIAAVVALALTLAFIVQFTSASEEGKKVASSSGHYAVQPTYPPYEVNSVNHQKVQIAEPSASVQRLQIAE